MIELILTKAEECRPLRAAVLRPGLPPKRSVYPGDEDERSLHFAVKDGKQVLGVLSLFRELLGNVGSEVWRIRGLAVDPQRQRQGLGRMLMLAAQAVVEKRGGGAWANVRLPAEPFYTAFGFLRQGEEFDVPDTGPHVVMTWRPKP